MTVFQWLFGKAPEAKPGDGERSPHWPAVRAAHLKLFPACAACGRRDGEVQVHHKLPFHVYPELELAPDNLISVCEGTGRNCHFTLGHFYDWRAYNPAVVADAAHYRKGLTAAWALAGGHHAA